MDTDAGRDLYTFQVGERSTLTSGEAVSQQQAVEPKEEADQFMDEFLPIACHELKSPLSSMKGIIQLVERHLKAASRSQQLPAPLNGDIELLQAVDHQINRLNRLINDLLDKSRIKTGKMEMNFSACNLVTIVDEIIDEQRFAMPTCPIYLHVMTPGAVPIFADADRIGQVIINYLSNAMKYAPADQPIEVSIHVEGAIARVLVRDQGPGLPEEEHALIWQCFHQAHDIREQGGAVTGLGLGLYISKVIIEQHQGQVGVQSEPGKGSTFWFTLPLMRPANDEKE